MLYNYTYEGTFSQGQFLSVGASRASDRRLEIIPNCLSFLIVLATSNTMTSKLDSGYRKMLGTPAA